MFEKIYMHSVYEQKKNKIYGLKEYLFTFVMTIPFMLLIMSMISYFYRPLVSGEFTVIFSIILVVCIISIGMLILVYIKNSSKVFAIGKNGKVYIMNMTKEAASYLSLNTAMQNMGKAGDKPNIQAMKAMGKTAADAFDKIDDSDVEKRIENADLSIDKVHKVVVKKKKLVVYFGDGKKSRITIPKMYNEVDELEHYFVHMSCGDKSDFKFYKRTKEEIMNERIRKNPNKIFINIFCAVLWLFVYNFASDLNRCAIVEHNYKEATAIINEIEYTDDKTLLSVSYEVENESVDGELELVNDENYEINESINIYYDKEDVDNIIAGNSVSFLIKPFVVLLIGFEAMAAIMRLLLKKK